MFTLEYKAENTTKGNSILESVRAVNGAERRGRSVSVRSLLFNSRVKVSVLLRGRKVKKGVYSGVQRRSASFHSGVCL